MCAPKRRKTRLWPVKRRQKKPWTPLARNVMALPTWCDPHSLASSSSALTPAPRSPTSTSAPRCKQITVGLPNLIQLIEHFIPCSVNQNGKKKTLTLTRQCCYGYGRPRNADFTTPCEKIDIKDVEATASDMGAKQFLESARTAGELADMLGAGSGKKVTLFVPNDAAFMEYRGHHQQENVSMPLVTKIHVNK